MKRPQPRPLDFPRLEWRRFFWPALIAVLLIAAISFGGQTSGTPAFCGSCHQMEPYLKSMEAGTHRDAYCTDCHESPGILGSFIQRAKIIGYYNLTSTYFRRYRPYLASTVDGDSCLRCHQEILTSTLKTRNKLLVSHKEFISAGLGCGRCHRSVGHRTNSTRAKPATHVFCAPCHRAQFDQKGCAYCHLEDVGLAAKRKSDDYRMINLDIETCTNCHQLAVCSKCHQARPKLTIY